MDICENRVNQTWLGCMKLPRAFRRCGHLESDTKEVAEGAFVTLDKTVGSGQGGFKRGVDDGGIATKNYAAVSVSKDYAIFSYEEAWVDLTHPKSIVRRSQGFTEADTSCVQPDWCHIGS
jgi:hypothetical protein